MKWIEKLPRWFSAGLVLPLLALNAWIGLLFYQYFEGLIKISLAAALLAFVLGYPVGALRRLKLPRSYAVILVLLLAIATLAVLGVTVIPILIEQINELATRLPSWLDSGAAQLDALQAWIVQRNLPIELSKFGDQIEARLSSLVQNASGVILGLLPDAIGSVLDFALTLVLTIYLLLHGDRLWDGIFRWLPDRFSGQIRPLLSENFQNYFAGQLTLAAVMGVAMTIAFVAIQVPFGLLFGIGVGILAVFPFGTATGVAIVSLLTALKSIWLGVRVLAVALAIAQVVENAIAPSLIGGFTGLNPVWILISLLVGAKLGGVLGLVIAVPLASCIKDVLEMIRDEPDTDEPNADDNTGGSSPSLTAHPSTHSDAATSAATATSATDELTAVS